jgi:hypothetical protein
LLRRFQRIEEQGIQERINAYREFSKNHRIKVQVPLVRDFNLVPIEDGLSLLRKRCKKSVFAKSHQVGSIETNLLAYLQHLKDRMVFYGSLRGRNERMPIGYRLGQFPPPMFSLSPPVLNPRFEAGKIVVDSQFFHNDSAGNLAATNVTYERLYVLRPNLTHVINQLNRAKATTAALHANESA